MPGRTARRCAQHERGEEDPWSGTGATLAPQPLSINHDMYDTKRGGVAVREGNGNGDDIRGTDIE